MQNKDVNLTTKYSNSVLAMNGNRITDSDSASITENSNDIQTDRSLFSTPRLFGKQKGSGISVYLPTSATDFLLRVLSHFVKNIAFPQLLVIFLYEAYYPR